MRFLALVAVLAAMSLSAAATASSKSRSQPAAGYKGEVVLFATSWCGYCRKARTYLTENKIRYKEIDIETEAGSQAYAKAGGRDGIPYLVAGKVDVRGFSPESYDAVFKPRTLSK